MYYIIDDGYQPYNFGYFISIFFSVLYLSIIISIFHGLLCMSNIYLWKFAFLLPGDIIYYIIAKNKGYLNTEEVKITIELPEGSELIRQKPEQKTDVPSPENGSKLPYKIGKLSSGESQSSVLWLHTNNNKIIIPPGTTNKSLELTINHCDWANGDVGKLGIFYLLLSKNAILLLIRLLVLAFLILFILLENPPLNIVTEPLQIQKNWTAGEEHFAVISVKNIGCNLLHANLSFQNSCKGQLINAKWVSSWSNIIKPFNSSGIEFINLSIEDNCTPGEYKGSIIISANASRKIGFPFYRIIGNTSTRKLAEVPVFITITPRQNAAA